MRILLINPLGVNVYDELVDEVVRPAVSSDTELTVRSLAGTGVPETAFLPAASLLMNQLLSAVQQGESDGFDAVVIGCASDPGLVDAKELVSIPVTAPMEAAVATGRAFGRLAVVAPRIDSGEGENLPQDANWARRLVSSYGGEQVFHQVGGPPFGTGWRRPSRDRPVTPPRPPGVTTTPRCCSSHARSGRASLTRCATGCRCRCWIR
ncbi:MAG: hypothetical protein F4236_00615 [Acidimicrobiia bacterium]|nr:hypothetical protein [Acidimicrobiia bacterium]